MPRTFDDIIPPSRRTTAPAGAPPPMRPREVSTRPPRFPYATLIIALLVIGAAIAALFYFSTAKVTITPNSVSAAVQNPFTATQSGGDLPFELITAEKVATKSVKGSGTRNVETRASGRITIYNTQAASQRLIASTRFASAAGLIFRIRDPITVPGGSSTNPGTLEVTVYADQPGSTYNIAPTSFTVPGFAGTPQASAVYARSAGPMTGGASGTIPIADVAEETAALAELESALSPELSASLENEIPAGYVLVPGSATTTFTTLTPSAAEATGMVDITLSGSVTAVVFPTAALAKAIASSVSGLGYQGEPVTLASTADLALTPTAGLPGPDTTTFTFTISGTASIIYTVDPARIAAAISGKTRSEAEVVLTNYPEVRSAVIVLRPFWRQTFPQDPAAISVVVSTAD